MQTHNVGVQRGGGVDTSIADQDGIWRPTDSNIRTAPTHGKIEKISEKVVYRKFIKDSEFETREVFERENSARENVENIGTRLETTRLDDHMTRSENRSTRSEKHKPKVDLDPDPSSSDSLDPSSSDSALKKKKNKKKKNSRKH